jgi:peroxiredoxin
MAGVTLGGNPITVSGNVQKKGDSAPEFAALK